MQPKIELLSDELVGRIMDEAYQLMMQPGIKVQSEEARQLLADAGAQVSTDSEIVKIPQKVIEKALETVPHVFSLYDRNGNPTVTYGGDVVQFDPGSSGVHVLDPETLEHRPSLANDLVRVVKITEMLSQYDAQSTAIVCNEIPKAVGDLYRLYVVLLYSNKPIVTGSFSIKTLDTMIEMLAIFAGGRKALAEKPQAVFDVCPSPPLIWSEFGSQNLIELARAGVPAEMVSMPLAGGAGPVTLLGSVVQHAAECLSGIAIHQLAQPGSPIVWGGAPAIFDMRKGSTPFGAVETAMIDASYAQVGKCLGLPTHAYLGASDSKLVDAQAGLESGMTAMIGALAGINMISGAGMLDFLACQSPEKLVMDAEAIGMVKRLLAGMKIQTETLATAMFEGINFKGDFLKQKITRDLFAKEQYLPSSVIDRASVRAWQADGGTDAFTRAKIRTTQLLSEYQRPQMDAGKEKELLSLVESHANLAGMDKLPDLDR
ncbi:MAG: trimethylamine methyltransferase family protein [Chloroflexi bacterium]|nr:trimethylamine methyltransferase family protein [Chloroflexota bacterium]